jgi:hypothetical protein
MAKKQRYIILLITAFIILFASCKRVEVRVEGIPPNTPKGQPIYITGNFNNWDPGEDKYQMQLHADSTYSVKLPPGFGAIEYKFTRGDWTTVEKDLCGYEIDNRLILLGENDTVTNNIESWNDLDPVNCPRITLVLSEIPENTPENDKIAVAGNFNSWNPDESTELKIDSSGKYTITIDRPPNISELEFKMTRGDLSSAESDEFGNIIPNRIVKFGVKDTVEVNIDGWIDRKDKKVSSRVILILKNLPGSTPANDELFFVSSLNNWTAGDRNYIFQMNKNGNYFYPMPRKRKMLEYKITRGDWASVEVDKYGFDIPNRMINLVEDDTVYLDVHGWKDKTQINDYEVTIVLSSLPETTPENPDIYITGNFNGWAQRNRKHKFMCDENGTYLVNLPRQRDILEFKILRGSWNTIELDENGSDIPNRIIFYKDFDTLYVDVANWRDIPTQDTKEVIIVINSLPVNTPQLEEIYLAPDFNGWNPGDSNMIFQKLADGRLHITIPKHGYYLEYKITRGSWGNVEVDELGNEIPNRITNYGFADTVFIDIVKWRDFDGNY